MTADPSLTQLVRDQHEDAMRTGIGMCIRLAELEIAGLTSDYPDIMTASKLMDDGTAGRLEGLIHLRDLMRTMSAEFTLDGAGA